MCLITVIPQNATPEQYAIAETGLRDNWERNPHGAGFCFAANGRVMVRKAYWRRRQFLRALRNAWRLFRADSAFVAHLRYATHGEISARNTHPHVLPLTGAALVHNGIVMHRNVQATAEGPSDTVLLCEMVDGVALDVLTGTDALLKIAGRWNKFALLDTRGRAHVVNAEAGAVRKGVWFSTSPEVAPRVSWDLGALWQRRTLRASKAPWVANWKLGGDD